MRPVEKLLIPLAAILLIAIIPLSAFQAAAAYFSKNVVLMSFSATVYDYRVIALAALMAVLTLYGYLTKYLGSHRILFSVLGLIMLSAPFFYDSSHYQFRSELELMAAIAFMVVLHTVMVKNGIARLAYFLMVVPALVVLSALPYDDMAFVGYAVLTGSFVLFGSTRNISIGQLNQKAVKSQPGAQAAPSNKRKINPTAGVSRAQQAVPPVKQNSPSQPSAQAVQTQSPATAPQTVPPRPAPAATAAQTARPNTRGSARGQAAARAQAAAAQTAATMSRQSGTPPAPPASVTAPAVQPVPQPAPAPVPVAVQKPPAPTPAPPKQQEKQKKTRASWRRTRYEPSSDELPPANVPWPAQSDYAKAMQNLDFSIASSYPDMKSAKVMPNPYVKLPGNIVYSSGNYGTIFKLENNGSSSALKCFTRSKPDLNRRYAAISRALQSHAGEGLAFVDFQYLPKAIRTFRNPGIYFPVLTMHWIEGTNLNMFISEQVRNRDLLNRVASSFLDEMIKIRRAGIAHGDIAGDNIVINGGGRLTLVDYDGMYVPEFSGLKAEEFGHDNFQHPARGSTTYSERLDNFSILITYLSMVAVAQEPSLWPKYNKGDQDCLIFRKSDFTDPSHSNVMSDLLRMRGRVAALTKLLADALDHDPLWGGCDPQNISNLANV